MARVLRTTFVAAFCVSLSVAAGDIAGAAIAGPTATINQASAQADPTSTAPVLFTITFSAPVTGFTGADIRFTGSTAPGVLSADVAGSGASYTAAITGMTAPGKVIVSIPAGAAQDGSGTGSRAATSSDATVTFDNVAPSVTINQSSLQSDPTGASLIYFSVRFSEPVTGFTGSDVSFAGSTVGGSLLPFVSGSGTRYTVAVSGMSGNGTVVASIRAGAARDNAGNASIASTSTDNVVTYKSAAGPSVTIDQASSQSDPTNLSPAIFTVLFSAPVTGFDASDVSFAGSTVGGTPTAAVSGSGAAYTVSVTGMTGRGAIVASLPAGAAKDASNRNSAASTSTDNVITFDNVPPAATINQASTQTDPTNAASILFTVIFSETVSGLSADDVSFVGSTVGGSLSASITGTGSLYTVAVSGMTGNGSVVVSLKAGAATDAAGNSSTASTSTDHTVTYLSTGPAVTINQAANQPDPTNTSPIVFSVVFTSAVTGFNGSDINFAGSTAGGTLSASVAGSGATYTVSVAGVTSPGTVVASIPAGAAVDSLGNASAASTSSDNSVSFNATGPSVTISQLATQADPVNAGPILFNAIFSAPVTGFVGTDVSFAGSTVGGTLVANVSGSGTTYTVSVSGMSGTGAVIVRIPEGVALDALGNGNQASTSTDSTVTFDSVAPTVTINQASGQADPVSAAPLLFTVAFSEPVTGFTAGDLSFAGSTAGGALTATITGTGPTYTAAVSGMTTAGAVMVSVNAGAVTDAAGNASVASTSSDNVVTFDNVAPTVTINQATGQGDPTSGSPILFTVVFSEPVTGFAPADVSFAGSTVGGTLGANVSGSGTTYTVSITGMNGTGSVVASVVAGAAMDAAGNASAGSTSTDNSVSYSSTGPTVTINQAAAQSDPTRAGPIGFNVIFSAPVTGFDGTDVSFAGSTVGGTLTATVTGSGATYSVSVTGMSGTGAVVATIAAGKATDLASNGNQASTSTDNAVTFDDVAPTVTINQASGQADPTASNVVSFTVIFSEPVSGFAAADVLLAGTTAGGTLGVNVSGSGTTYTVLVSGVASPGAIVANVASGAAIDAAGNPSAPSTSTDNSVTFDNAPPTVTINQAATQADPANVSPVVFSVLFSEPVTGFAANDVSFAGSTVGGTLAANVSGSGAAYTVVVTGMIGNGTIVANIVGGAARDLAGNQSLTSASVDNTVTFNATALTVTIDQAAGPIGQSGQADPTGASPIAFTVIFSAPVTGFSAADVDLSSSTVGGSLTATVVGNGLAYSVYVTGMNGTGTVVARIPAGAAVDGIGNPNAASTSTDNSVTFDNVAPTVTINQAAGQSDPASTAPVVFTVVFSEPVVGFGASDVSFVGSTVGGTLVATVSGTGANYTVSVTGMSGAGTIVASIPAAAAVDLAGNSSIASTSADNSVTFGAGGTPVSVTINQAATQTDPTNASPIVFSVVFSTPVIGFTGGDVSFAGSTLTGLVANVAGSGAAYTVSVTGMNGTGTVVASIPAGVAQDVATNSNAASTSTDNTVTFDNVGPTVTINQAAAQVDPTNASPVVFAVTFSESVTGFTPSDVSFAGSTVGGALVANVSGSGTTYTVSVTGMTGNGTVVATIPAGAAQDAAGNLNAASTSTDNTVTHTVTGPTVTINQAAAQPDPTNIGLIEFTVVFSAPVTGFSAADVSFAGSTLGGLVADILGSGTTYSVIVTGMNGTGTVIASIPAGAATDALGNPSQASTSTDHTVTFDNVVPTVTINQAAGQPDPTNASPILFTVVFSEPVTGFTSTDISLAGSTAGGTLVANVSGSGPIYTVSVTGMTGTGTVIASVIEGAARDAAVNSSGASTSTDNSVTFNAVGPTVTINQAAAQPDPTNTTPIVFNVLFSTPVTGFTAADISFAGSTLAGLSASVTGSGAGYNVSVTGMTGTGTVVATIPAGAAIDAVGNPSQASTSTDNAVAFDNVAPSVTINQSAAQVDPTNASPILFTVVFSEPVTGFAAGDVVLTGTVGGAPVANVTGSGTTYTVAVTGMTGTGTVIATIPAATANDAAGNLSVASTSADNTVTFTATGPTVTINQGAGQADPTNTTPITFSVVFSAPVTGFTGSDVSFTGSSVGGTLAASVTGSGATYTVAVTGMTDSGTVVATIPDGAAVDGVGNPSSASTSFDNKVTFDIVAPTVTINQAFGQADPTNASPVVFTVGFSEPVTGFTSGDVVFTGSTVGGTLVANVTGSGGGYTVSVTGMNGSGTVIVSIPAAAATDATGNPSVASTSTDNTVTFSNVAPTVTINQAAGQIDPTNAAPVVFTVAFSVPVTGFTGTDVDLTGSTAPGTLVANVTGSGAIYTVSVTGMTAPGTVLATIPAGAATDGVNNSSQASTSADNTVTFDNIPPTVTINQAAGQPDPINSSPILFSVVFSEPIIGFTGSDVSFAGSTVGGTLVANISGSGASYTVSVTGMNGSGTVVASIPAGVVTDPATNPNVASTSTDNTVSYNPTALTVTINQAAAQTDPTNASPIVFDVLFSAPVTGFTGADLRFTGSTAPGTLVANVTGSGSTYTVSVTGMTGAGTVVASIPADAAQDAATNSNQASTSLDNTVTYDTVAPTVTINQAAGQTDPTNGSPILFTVTFSEAVTGFTAGDVSLAGSSVGGTLVANVSGSGTTYTVSVVGMTGTGTVVASIPGGAAQDTAGNTSVTSTSTDNTVTFNGVGPTVTINQAAGQADPTNASPVQFTVVFSAPVTGFTGADVNLASSTVGGTLVANVAGSGANYTVSVTGMTGSGAVVASIPAGAAQDAATNSSQASTSTDNSVTFDNVAPTITINQAASQTDPTSTSPILFTVVFSEPVTGFAANDVSFAGSTVGGTLSALISGNGPSYTVSVSGMTGSGTVVATIPGGAATDLASNPSGASTSTDNTVTFNTAAVTVTINRAAGQADPTRGSPIVFSVVFSVPVTGFTTADVSLSGTTAPGAIVSSVSGGGANYTVGVSGMTGSGTVVASIPAGAAVDSVGNLNQASTSTDNSIVYDVTGPQVTSAVPSGTTSGPVDRITLTFSEAISTSTFTLADVVSLTGPGGALPATAVNALNSQQFEVIFPSQTSGTFTLVIGPDIFDAVSNPMDQNANGVNGEPVADQYTTSVTIAPAALTTVTPNAGQQGQTNLNVVVTGQSTHFVNGVTTAGISGGGVTVNSVTVTSPTSVTLNIDVSPIAALGSRTITVTTNTELVSSSAAGTFFTVTEGPAAIASANPDHANQTDTLSVDITGFATHFANGSTNVSFGSGITVNSILVTGPTLLTANITVQPSAVVGPRTVTVTTAGETAVATNGFTVNQVPPFVSSVSPVSGHQGEALTVSVNGQFTHFDSTTTADFGPGIVVNSVVATSATSATVNISIDPDAAQTSRTVIMRTGSETAQRVGAFTVLAGIATITSITPVAGVQGTSNTLVVLGNFTHFAAGTGVSMGPGIVVGTATVNGPELLSVPFTITDGASTGPRDVTVVTGTEVVTLFGGFTVLPGFAEVTVIDPNAGQIGMTLNVTITGHFTSWQNGVTHVSYGAGVTVNSNVVSSPTQLTNNITIDANATLGPRDVVVTTNAESLTVFGGLTVTDVDVTSPSIRTLSPESGAVGVPLNAVPTIEMNEPLKRSSVTTTSIQLYDSFTGQPVPDTVKLDATGRIITVVPTQLLAVSRTYIIYIGWNALLQDVAGNQFGGTYYYFTTGFTTETTGPTLQLMNPPNGEPGVALNAGISLKFDHSINAAARAAGLQILKGGVPVPGTFTFADSLRQINFAPAVPWDASSTYTVALSTGLIDLAGNSLTNPGNRTFTTGTATDTTAPTLIAYSPSYNATNVGLHPIISVTYSEAINPITVNPATFFLYNVNLNIYVPATLTLAADRSSATLTPVGNLNPYTIYYFYTVSFSDTAGNVGGGNVVYFTTGGATDTIAPTVVSATPANGTANVPVNALVLARMSESIDATSLDNATIQLTPSAAGSVSLLPDQATIKLTLSGNFTPSTTYTIHVVGARDLSGNTMVPFTATFTTAATATPDTTGPTVLTFDPPSGSTLALNAPLSMTLSEPIDASRVGVNSMAVYVNNNGVRADGTYTISDGGTKVTFTPSAPYPVGSVVYFYSNVDSSITDFAGNVLQYTYATFTTVGTPPDVTAPTVVSVTPVNGTLAVGPQAVVTLTFSESMNGAVIDAYQTFALFAGGTRVSASISRSADNRMVFLTGSWPLNAVMTVVATGDNTDLAGNHLAPFSSTFTTAAAFDPTAASIVTQLPIGSGVAPGTPITLYVNKPLDASTVSGAFYVSQNGILVDGNLTVSGTGTALTFTPAASFQANATIQVFVTNDARDTFGNRINPYSGAFTIAPDPAITAPVIVRLSPSASTVNNPLNSKIEIEFSEALNPSTIASNVIVRLNDVTPIAGTLTLQPGNRVVRFAPTLPLLAGVFYTVNLSTGIQDTQGTPFGGASYYFYTGTETDNTAPAITSIVPSSGLTGVGINASVRVIFSEAINPLSVTPESVIVSSAAGQVPVTFQLASNNTSLRIIPQVPLPANSLITLSIDPSDVAGNELPVVTSQFMTGPAADTVAPSVISSNWSYFQTGVPTNTVLDVTFSEPMDVPSVLAQQNTMLYDNRLGTYVPGTLASTDARHFTFTPASALAVNRAYSVQIYTGFDLAGNGMFGFTSIFVTDFAGDTTPPLVTGVNPLNAATNAPRNTRIRVLFNEPVGADSAAGIRLLLNGTPVPFSSTIANGNRLATLTPSALLASNTAYTISVQVRDTSGNLQPTPFQSTFTTGDDVDLIAPTITGTSLYYGQTGVPLNPVFRVAFSEPIDPVTIDSSGFLFYNPAGQPIVPATITVAADRRSATLTPTGALLPGSQYFAALSNYTDSAGNFGQGTGIYFITGTQADAAGPAVISVTPANGAAGVAVNARVVVVMNEPVDQTSVANSIHLTPAVPGTVTLNTDQVTLTFSPSSPLSVSTTYAVNVSGLRDLAANTMTAFNSSFATGASSTPDITAPTIISMLPVDGAAGVAVNSAITFTTSEPITRSAVGPGSMPVFALIPDYGYAQVAGSYSVDSTNTIVTFTPAAPYPANTTVFWYTNYNSVVVDAAGNPLQYLTPQFTTGSTADITAPTLLSVTPADGASQLGPFTTLTLTFSESVSPATVNERTLALFNGSTRVALNITRSLDNRMVFLPMGLQPDTTYTVVGTSDIEDLSGNSFAGFSSSFTTAPFDATRPSIVTQRPTGSGVISTTSVTLFVDSPLNPATVPAATFVSQNGSLVPGIVTVSGGGRVIGFTPSAPFAAGAVVEIAVTDAATDPSRNPLFPYFGQFLVGPDPATTVATLLQVSPLSGTLGNPVNSVIELEFSEPLDASTVTNANVRVLLNGGGSGIAGTLSLRNGNRTIHFKPAADLQSGGYYQIEVSAGVRDLQGTALAATSFYFYVGAQPDNTAPAAPAIAPPQGSSGVGVNALGIIRFDEPVNPTTINTTNVTLTAGPPLPFVLSHTDNRTFYVTPQAPLPSSTVVTLAVSNVEDLAGNKAPTTTRTFVTAPEPDTIRPSVIASSPVYGESNVPVNLVLQLRFSEPMDPGGIAADLGCMLYDYGFGCVPGGAASLSPDGLVLTYVPPSTLAPSTTYAFGASSNLLDLAGNPLNGVSFNFFTSSVEDHTAPTVVAVSPPPLSGVGRNALIEVVFDEPIRPTALDQVNVLVGGSPLAVASRTLSNGNRTLTVTLSQLMAANTVHTISIAGVQDLAGNTMSTVTSSFTTGSSSDLIPLSGTVVFSPDGTTTVPVTVTPTIQFSEAVSPVRIWSAPVGSGISLYVPSLGQYLPITYGFSADYRTVTVTPTAPLQAGTQYQLIVYYFVTDLTGNAYPTVNYLFFTTQ